MQLLKLSDSTRLQAEMRRNPDHSWSAWQQHLSNSSVLHARCSEFRGPNVSLLAKAQENGSPPTLQQPQPPSEDSSILATAAQITPYQTPMMLSQQPPEIQARCIRRHGVTEECLYDSTWDPVDSTRDSQGTHVHPKHLLKALRPHYWLGSWPPDPSFESPTAPAGNPLQP